MLKIVLNQKRILLTTSYAKELSHIRSDAAILSFAPSQDKLIDLVDLLLVSEMQYLVIEDNIQDCLDKFKRAFTLVIAGGGLVKSYKNDFLFIYRHRQWDLPKGKIEEGEDIAMGSIREVKEETGLQEISILEKIRCTYHMYFENELLLKETHWYLMQAEDYYLRPQQEEGISRAIWVHPNNISYQLSKTYDSVLEIFRAMGYYFKKGSKRPVQRDFRK